MARSFLVRGACDGERACYRQGAIFGGFVPRLLTWFASDYDLGFGIPMLRGTCVGAAPLVIAPLLGAQPSTPSSNPTTAFDETYVGV